MPDPTVGWGVLRYFLLCFQMTYGKVLLQNVKLDTVWGPVLYTNLLSIPPTIVLAVILGDFKKMETAEASENANLWVSLSCVVGESAVPPERRPVAFSLSLSLFLFLFLPLSFSLFLSLSLSLSLPLFLFFWIRVFSGPPWVCWFWR